MNSKISLLDVIGKNDHIFDYSNDIKNTLYILDTNVLLAPLKLMNASELFIKSLEKEFSNTYIPIIAYMEFILNHKDIIKQTKGFVDEGYSILAKKNVSESFTIKKEDLQKIFLEKIKVKKSNISNQSHYKKNIEKEANKLIESILENINQDLNNVNTKIKQVLPKDEINEKYSLSIYNQQVEEYINELKKYFNSNTRYSDLYPVQEFDTLKREAEERFAKDIGPGNADIKNKKDVIKRISELEWDSSLGDSILWLESIKYSVSVKE